jgi:hypothetical protein
MIITLMMKIVRTSETSVSFYQTTWRDSSEDSHLQITCLLVDYLFRNYPVKLIALTCIKMFLFLNLIIR